MAGSNNARGLLNSRLISAMPAFMMRGGPSLTLGRKRRAKLFRRYRFGFGENSPKSIS